MATLKPSTEGSSRESSPEDSTSNDTPPPAPIGDARKSKSGRHSRFTAQEDLIIVREVAAAGAHIAPFGQTKVLFEKAAEKCNGNTNMKSKVTWKTTQDRYKRLQETFDKEDGITHVRSGIGGGELSELNELLSQMKEARDDLRARRNEEKEKVSKEEEEKERIGKDLVAASLSRQKKLSPDYNSAEESGGSSDGRRRAKQQKKRRTSHMSGDLAAFGEQLRDSGLARIAFEREQLQFERHKYEKELLERDKDREDRKEEREAANKLELEKMKVMFEAFRKGTN